MAKRNSDDEFKMDATFILIQAAPLSDAQLGAFLRAACHRVRLGSKGTHTVPKGDPKGTVWEPLSTAAFEQLFNTIDADGTKVCGWLEDQLAARELFRERARLHGAKGGRPTHQRTKDKKPTHRVPLAHPMTAPVPTTPPATVPGPEPTGFSTASAPGISTPGPTSAPISVSKSSSTVKEESLEKSRVQPSSVVGATEKKSDFTKANLAERKQRFIDHCTAVNAEKNTLDPAELAKFLNHFTMHNPDGFKMLFEIQRTKKGVWSAAGHMVTWRDRNKQWNADKAAKAGGSLPVSNADDFDERI